MKKKDQKTDEKIEDTIPEGEIIPLKLITGGRLAYDNNPPERTDWLSELDIGTTFICGDKHSADYISPEYLVIDKVPGFVRLRLESPSTGGKTELWVVSNRFSQKYYLGYILGVYTSNED